MPYDFPPDVEQLVKERMNVGDCDSEDDVLRDALHALRQEEADLAAVQQAVQELKGGDAGVPLEDAFESIRKKHGMLSMCKES